MVKIENFTKYINLFFRICIFMVSFGYVFDLKIFINTFFFLGIFFKIFLLKKEIKNSIILLKNRIDMRMILLMVIFSLSLLISTYYSVNWQQSLKYAEHYIKWMFIAFFSAYLLMYNLNVKDFEREIIYGLCLGEVIIVSGVLWKYFILNMHRPDSFFIVHPNATAGMIVFLLPFVVLNDQLNKYWRLCLFVLITVSLLLTESRGALIAYILLVLIIIFKNMHFCINTLKKINWKYMVIIFATLLLTVVSNYDFFAVNNNRFLEVFDNYENLRKGYVGGDRLLLWESSINIIKDYPLFGIGLNNFNDVYNHGYISELAREPHLQSPHNIILHFFVETGFFGGISFLLIFFYQLTKLKSNNTSGFSFMFLLSIISILVHGMVDYIFLKKAFYQLYWYLGCIVLLSINDKFIQDKYC